MNDRQLAHRLRARAHALLEGDGARRSRPGAALDAALVSLVVASAVVVTLESVAAVRVRHTDWLQTCEHWVAVAFCVEYVGRLWVAAEQPGPGGAWARRARWATSFLGLVDLVAIAPLLLGTMLPADLLFLRLFRVLRIVKLGRYAPALGSIATVIRRERRSIYGSLLLLAVLLFVAASVMHLIEAQAQPLAFGSIPASMWWAMATLTTVGYGDVTPITPAGRLVGGLVMVLGIGVFGLWTSILATGYLEEHRRRGFVVSWNLVASMPLFQGLDAARVARIVDLLRPETVPPRYTVIRRGESGDCMYFVVAGEVEVDRPPHPVRLGPGQYFGEVSLLRAAPRNATVTSVTECRLLRLDRTALQRLLASEPSIRESVEHTARTRAPSWDEARPG
ncbi:MAG: ion transporter [Ectothiorhodospiraceae bacterium]|nr:ion transporter [Ectothiorhodospiraceae bacterium]